MTVNGRFPLCCRPVLNCDRPTDHATRSVATGRIYVRSTASVPTIGLYTILILDTCYQFLKCACLIILFPSLIKGHFITFRVSRRRREMYCGHARLCLCVCLCVCPQSHAHTIARTRV